MAQETLEISPAACLFIMDNCLKNVVNIEFFQADFWSFKFHLKFSLFALEQIKPVHIAIIINI